MIREITLTNWKSFDQATLFIDPLTVLIGSNASGKSNTLDALLFLNRISNGVALSPAIAGGDASLPPLRGGMEWVCRKPETQFTLSVVIDGDVANTSYRYDLTVAIHRNGNGIKAAEVCAESLTLLTYRPRSETPKDTPLFYTKLDEPKSPSIPTYCYTATQGHGTKYELNRASIILAQVATLNVRAEVQTGAKQVLSQLQKIFVFDPIPSHMRGYTPLSEKLLADGSNISGVLAGLAPERKVYVESTLTQYSKGLPERDVKRIWTEPVGKFKNDAMLYCEEGWDSQPTREVDARGMSDGTLRYLAIVTALLTREPGSLLVIEEVDNGLHPSRAHFLVDMLKKLGLEQRVDVLVTTHNPALLDAAGVTMIPVIVAAHRDNSTGFSRLTQLEDIAQLPKLIASGSLGQLSSRGQIETALQHAKEAVQ